MWFNQITCDYCHRLLTHKTIDKCYVVIKYTDRKVLESDISFRSYLPLAEAYPIHFAVFNQSRPQGKLYIYNPVEDDFNFQNRRMFCDNDCAYHYSMGKTEVLYYFDKASEANRSVVQEMVAINNALGAPINKGLYTNIRQSLGITFQEEDLSAYNLIAEPFGSMQAGKLAVTPFDADHASELWALRTCSYN